MTVLLLLFIHTFFFFNDTATTEIYTLSLHDALPIYQYGHAGVDPNRGMGGGAEGFGGFAEAFGDIFGDMFNQGDRKSTRLNSSHQIISYAVFCLKKKKTDRSKNKYASRKQTSWVTMS